MSTVFINTLTALTINLAGTLIIYSLMAFFLARIRWRNRGVLGVIVMIVAVDLFWIVPTLVGLSANTQPIVSYSLFFGNWLVSAFSVILLVQTVRGIPRQLEDSARLDGCGWFGTYWHVVLPLVRGSLGLIALLIVLATTPHLTRQIGLDCYPTLQLPSHQIVTRMLLMSVIASLPVIGIFFVVKRRWPAM
jgi:multiple sugar transport system permease protein